MKSNSLPSAVRDAFLMGVAVGAQVELSTCPRCEHTGPTDSDFGYRTVRGVTRAQSWCRKCRASPNK